MLVYYIIMIFIIGATFFLKSRVYNNLESDKKIKILRIVNFVFIILFTIWYMYDDNAIDSIIALDDTTGQFSSFEVLINTFFHWFGIATVLITFTSVYFDIKQLKLMLRYFALPVSALLVVFFFTYGQSIPRGAATPFNPKVLIASMQVAIGFVLAFHLNSANGKLVIKRNDVFSLIIGIISIIIVTMPVPALRTLFGEGPVVDAIEFTVIHRIFIYFAFIIPTVIYLALHRKDRDYKKLWLIFICYGTTIAFMKSYSYTDLFSNGTFRASRLPIHLCHTAMIMMPILVTFKLPKFFYFTLFVNVVGAFWAILLPDYPNDLNLLSTRMVKFYLNHYVAFFMPFLLLVLDLYEKPTKKHFKYSSVAFAVYFCSILFINAWFSNFASVDYFFLNSDFIVKKIGLEATRDFTVSFNIGTYEFIFYPIYQTLFYIVYVLFSLFIWYLYEYMFKTADSWRDLSDKLHNIKANELALLIELEGKPLDTPINPEGVDMIELKNFSKRYGSSDVFAVKDANFAVNAGEVFGFLGPNGAGKSTIIKSLVGIQPVTEGNIEICGYDIMRQSVNAKLNMGFVPDHYALYEKLTGREYINYIADLYRVNKETRTERINHFLDIFELKDKFDNKMRTYSHGMKQKIAIIAALIHDPKVWILDEPLTGLDPNSIFQVKETMKLHAERGNIVFFSSHIMDVVERLCDKVAIINQGKILEVSTMEDILSTGTTLEEYYMDKITNSTHVRPKIKDNTRQERKSLKELKKEVKNIKEHANNIST